MSLLESLLYAVLGAVTSAFPLGQANHFELASTLLPIASPGDTQWLATKLGILAALLITLRHDLASLLSSLISVIVYRRRPATLDEHVPFYLTLIVVPYFAVGPHLKRLLDTSDWSLAKATLLSAALGGALWFLERWGRKSKAIFDLTWWDCGIVGALSIAAAIPGVDFLTVMLAALLLRNQRKESAVKITYLSLMIISAADLIQSWPAFQSVGTGGEISTMNFVLISVVATTVATVACFSFLAKPTNFGLYGMYRVFVMGGAAAWLWLQG